MIEEKMFEFFGHDYQTTTLSAMAGFDLLALEERVHPFVLLQKTAIIIDGETMPLTNKATLNTFVFDKANILSPQIVLTNLMIFVSDFNFKFLETWQGVQLPRKYINHSKKAETVYLSSICSTLISTHYATLKELQEYYSVQDAFILFDAYVAAQINELEAMEPKVKSTNLLSTYLDEIR